MTEEPDQGVVFTPSVQEFIEHEKQDHNYFWRLECGHHQNLLDEAIDIGECYRNALVQILGMGSNGPVDHAWLEEFIKKVLDGWDPKEDD